MSKEHMAPSHEVEHLLLTVPEELQAYPQFVGWELFTRQGKPTKVPLNPHTGYYANVTDPATWGSFKLALSFVARGRAKGIGFVFSENDPFTGTDLDHCIDGDNMIASWAGEIVDTLNSYTEYSPSGTGLHVITQAALPQGRRKDQLEMYSAARYFTLTGNHLIGTPQSIFPRQEEQEALYRSLAPRKVIEIYPGAASRLLPVREDDEVLKKALEAKNGEKFLRIWQGNTGEYRSKSEADFDLVLRLLYWTHDDVAQTKRLFRQSGLYDPEKTDAPRGKQTYLDMTVENALRKRRRR